jgi:hypothetical protein
MYEIEGPYVVSQHLPPIARRRTLSDLPRSQISRQEDPVSRFFRLRGRPRVGHRFRW